MHLIQFLSMKTCSSKNDINLQIEINFWHMKLNEGKHIKNKITCYRRRHAAVSLNADINTAMLASSSHRHDSATKPVISPFFFSIFLCISYLSFSIFLLIFSLSIHILMNFLLFNSTIADERLQVLHNFCAICMKVSKTA